MPLRGTRRVSLDVMHIRIKVNEPKIDKSELCRLASLLEAKLLATDSEVARNVLQRFMPLFEDAKQGKINSPYQYRFFPQEFWEDGELFNETELAETAAQFGLQLRGLNSKGHANA